ncbi:MAG TPA: glycosyltransferase family 2 protein [Candidatus Saccharimonadales bacterium]|nr:glycosyltransferase family 2 protein [Candidatus Saccharimonadales bacterium]
MSEPLTVIVPSFNEEKNIRGCLESVKWADEILLVDSYSTDATLEIARPLATRIIQREYVNSASQKNWAIPQAAHRWVMIVDSDEQVSEPLEREIRELLASGPERDGYVVRRLNHFHGKPIRHGGWGRDRVLRIFDREKGRYQEKHVHAEVEVRGSTGRLEHPLLHDTFRGFDDYLRKIDRYTAWGAADLRQKGRRARALDMVLRPAGRFVKRYLLQAGFLDGPEGLIITGIDAYVTFLKYARLWEMERAASAPPLSRSGGGSSGPER